MTWFKGSTCKINRLFVVNIMCTVCTVSQTNLLVYLLMFRKSINLVGDNLLTCFNAYVKHMLI